MRSLVLAVSLITLPLFAENTNIWFDPPNPTSRTPVTAHVTGSNACGPSGATAERHGNLISITLQFDCPPRVSGARRL